MKPPQLFAGSRTTSGYVDAVGTNARFEYPACMATDGVYLYVTEFGGSRVRRVNPETAEVDTVAVLSAGSNPLGISRHAPTGDFLVCCPRIPSQAGPPTIERYDASWSHVATITKTPAPPSLRWYFYHAVLTDDGTHIIGTGTIDPATSNSRTLRILPSGAALNQNNWFPNSNPGGITQVGSQVYYLKDRFTEIGLWRSALDFGGTNPGSETQVNSFPAPNLPGGISGRELHLLDDGDTMNMSFGPNNYDGSLAGNGARDYSLSTDTFTDPAPALHADGTATGSVHAIECDYLHAFDKHFVTSSELRMTTGGLGTGFGFWMYEMYTTPRNPHCIEIIGEPDLGWLVGAVGFKKTGFGL